LKIKKILSMLLLLTVMVTVLAVSASARYSHIDSLLVGLSIDSNGLAVCNGTVKPSDSNTRTELTVALEQKINGVWNSANPVESWTASGIGKATITKTGSRYVYKGTYRVVATAKVYDSSTGALLENESYISSERTY